MLLLIRDPKRISSATASAANGDLTSTASTRDIPAAAHPLPVLQRPLSGGLWAGGVAAET
jgi:hypothetical protein